MLSTIDKLEPDIADFIYAVFIHRYTICIRKIRIRETMINNIYCFTGLNKTFLLLDNNFQRTELLNLKIYKYVL